MIDVRIDAVYLPLLVGFVCSALSVWIIKYRNGFSSIIRNFIRYLALSILLATLTIYLWNGIAPRLSWTPLKRPFVDIRLNSLPEYSLLWILSSGWIVVIALNDIRRRKGKRPFDLIISHHPHDAMIAKLLADKIISSEKKVWLNSYEHLADHSMMGQNALIRAYRSASYALVLNNNDYLNSPECRTHLAELVKMLGSDSVMEFRIPDKGLQDQDLSERVHVFSNSAQTILDRIARKTGWELKKALPSEDILRNRVRAKPKKFDIFISYKSHDVEIVRSVVDILIASGLDVWFAEYQILLQGREQFAQAIDNGIDQSSFAIAFTNNRYIDSKYCRHEIKRLLERLGPGKILEVKIPEENLPHRLFPDLKRSPGYSGRTRDEMLRFITQNTGFAVYPEKIVMAGLPESFHEATCLGRPFHLNTTGWRLTKKGTVDEYGSAQGLEFKFQTRYPMFVNLYAGPETSQPGQRQSQEIDDRKMYDYLLEYAPRHLNVLRTRIKGVHLFFHKGLSQMVLTYPVEHYWTRKYSITIPNPITKDVAEFVFTFGFVGSFEELCLYTSIMDDFAKSLDWR